VSFLTLICLTPGNPNSCETGWLNSRVCLTPFNTSLRHVLLQTQKQKPLTTTRDFPFFIVFFGCCPENTKQERRTRIQTLGKKKMHQKCVACVVIWIALSLCAFAQTEPSSLRNLLGENKHGSSSSSSSATGGQQKFNITYCVGAGGCNGLAPYTCVGQSLVANGTGLCRPIPAGTSAWFPITGVNVNLNFTSMFAAPFAQGFWALALYADQACQKTLVTWRCPLSFCCEANFFLMDYHFQGFRITPA